MAKSVLELAVGTGQWDAGLKKAKSALDNFTQANGGLQSALNKDSKSMQTFVQMMGRMDSTAKTAKGQMNDYKGTIEQLTMQYNRLTDAQKQTIGQDYLRSIDQMKQKYQAVADEVAKINQSLKQTQEIGTAASSGGGLFGSDKLGGMLQVFGGNLMTKAAGMGIGFASELGDMVKQSIELARQGEGIRIAFERLGRGDILDGLRQATHGTVSDIELMKAAVKFNDFRLPLEELGTMLAFAQQKAKDTGQSVDYMVDSIVTGLGRKSLMILDNLGLSAAEIKERMAETGDMTKAVGEIIREQMSKAGDYIETAADRATKANVEVQNAMERLGETFQPLTDAGTSMFNSLKVGALDFINKALRPMINLLTEAGRMRKLYNAQKGTNDAKIQDMLAGLSSSELPQHQHRVNLAYWDKNINKYQQYLADYKTWQKDKTAVGAYDRMAAFQKETGLSMFSDVKEQLEVFKRQKADYVKLSKDLLTKKVEDNKVEEQSIDSLKKKLQELQAERKKAIEAGDTDMSKSLLKQINQIKTDIKGLGGKTTTTTDKPKTELEKNQAKIKELTEEYIKLGDKETEASQKRQAEIKKEIELLQQRNNLIGLRAEQVQGKLLGGNVQMPDFKNRSYIIDRSHLFDTEGGLNWQVLQKYNDQTSVGEYKWRKKEREKDGKKEEKKDDKLMDNVTKLTSGVTGIFSGIEQMGIEIPDGMKQALNAINGLMSIAQSILIVVEAIKGLEAIGLFKFAGGGVVHAAGGYTVPGNLYSGDQVPAMLNSGELVLNRAQQSTLASQLQGQDKQMHVVGEVQGEKIILVANRTFRRKGQGEIVTW
jgi:hypothetical protein